MDASQPQHLSERVKAVSDQLLVHRAVDGDIAAFAELIHRYGPLMRGYTARIVGSLTEADDIVQDAFYTAWRQLLTLREPAAVKSWLMRIASRHAFSYLRRKPATTSLTTLEVPLPASSQPENVVERSAQLEALSAALDGLKEDQRQCWLLREVGELSYDDIAAELDVPVTTVRGTLARARAGIYAKMEGWR